MSEHTDTIITCLCGQEIEVPGDIVSDEITKLKAEKERLAKEAYIATLAMDNYLDQTSNQRVLRKKAEAENTSQLAELTAISDALGTREGHSSVSHIEALKAEVRRSKDKMADMDDYYATAMDDRPHDEIHCTCVPGLKMAAEKAEAEVKRFREEFEKICSKVIDSPYIYAGKNYTLHDLRHGVEQALKASE